MQAQLAANRSQFYRDLPSGPFYGYNRPGAKPSEAVIQNWWRQGMMGGAKAHYDGIVAFSQTDFTEDLKKITVPVLVMHGDDDQIVPYADSAPLSAKLLKNGTLKTYKGFPHGMPTTEAATINADLLAFIKIMKVILFGATGMVGQGVLRECLVDAGVTEVLAVGRSPTGVQHAKLREVLHDDFTDFSKIESQLGGIRRLLLLPRRLLDRHGSGALPASDLRRHHGGGEDAGAAQPRHGVHLRHRQRH